MSVAELDEPGTERIRPSARHTAPLPSGLTVVAPRRHRISWLLVAGWIVVAAAVGYYSINLYRIGMDAREGFWVYWEQNRFQGDLRNAVQQANAVLHEADMVAAEDQQSQTPAARNAQAKLDAGQPPATIAAPGPGLFDRPWSLSIMHRRWQHLQPVYSQIYRGWVRTYDRLEREVPSGDYDLDYPPLRLMVMTLWTWKIESDYPGLSDYPSNPQQFTDPVTKRTITATQDTVRPILIVNRTFDMISTIAVFFLVWVWANRMPVGSRGAVWLSRVPGFGWLRRRELPITPDGAGWRARWGDPMLIVPAIVLLIGERFVRPYVNFDLAVQHMTQSYIDDRVSNLGWWIFITLRFIAVVSLARLIPRPFRGPVCGMVAATLVWLNPASILDSFGWPQYDVWLPPFFLVAALLVSVEWWLTAGLVLGVGCMFKGQLLFVAPVIVFCPLFAGWFGRFMRIVTGVAVGVAIVVWPWLVNNDSTKAYVASAVFAAAIVCLVSLARKPVLATLRRSLGTARSFAQTRWHQWRGSDSVSGDAPSSLLGPTTASLRIDGWIAILAAMVVAGVLTMHIHRHQPDGMHLYTTLLTVAVLAVPWFLPRRMLASFLVFAFAASLWIAAFSLSGRFSWWWVGFMYGTQKHQNMQLGSQSLSNLSSILEKRYRWELHDLAGTFHFGANGQPVQLDIQQGTAVLYGLTLLLCAVGAGMHIRRRDPRFLVALTAPWMLFVTLLTQLAARYTILPSIVACCLVGVSVGMSLFQLLFVTIACGMLGNQMLNFNPQIAPLTQQLTRPTHPDLGWTMVLLAGLFLFMSLLPSRRRPVVEGLPLMPA